MNDSNLADERQLFRVAGIAALLAGSAWVSWAVINGMTGGALDTGEASVGLRLAKFGQLLEIAWNLLLLPGALILWKRLQRYDPNLILLYTICGLLSLSFWAIAGAAKINSPMLEVSYLLLSGVWWTGIGRALRKSNRIFGTFTVILGLFTLIDATLSFFEPMPFYIYALAAPKLPLGIGWDFWLGYFLLTSGETYVTVAPRPIVEISA